MKKILTGIVAFFSISAFASTFYVQSNVSVSGEGQTVLEAQNNAVAEGQKEAFMRLMKKIAPTIDMTEFEMLDVTAFVQDVSLSDEKVSASTYKGNLSVRFKSEPIYELLKNKNEPFLTSLPEQMLLIPVFEENGNTVVFDKTNPILTYFHLQQPTFDFFPLKVVLEDENKIAEASKVWQEGLFEKHSSFLNEYEVTKALVFHVKKSNDVYEVKTFVLPKNVDVEASVEFQVMDDREDINLVMKDLVQDAFLNMEKKWIYLTTKNVAPVVRYQLLTPVSKVSELKKIKDKINQLNFVEQIEIKGFKNKMLIVEMAFKGSTDELQQKLLLNDMALSPYLSDEENNVYLLTFVNDDLNLNQKQTAVEASNEDALNQDAF